MKKAVTFRCQSRTDRSEYHRVTVNGTVALCSCNGVDWCSHIDATLAHGETHMVPPEDRRDARKARRIMSGIIKPPRDWKSTWMKDRVWRGLVAPKTGELDKMLWDRKPTISFVGSGEAGSKSDYIEHAQSLGWRHVESVSNLTTLVVWDTTTRSEAIDDAEGLDLPTINHSQWDEWCYEFTDELMKAIEKHEQF